jgi:hypothetical protein
MRPRSVLAALGTALVLVTAGACGSGTPVGGSPVAAPQQQKEPVAWMDEVCGALGGFANAALNQPQIDQNDPEAAVNGLKSYLGSISDALGQSISGLQAVGPSPVANGDEAVRRLTATLQKFQTSINTAQQQLADINPNDPQDLQRLPEALAPLQELGNVQNPLADLESSPELEAAAAQAPKCKEFQDLSNPN